MSNLLSKHPVIQGDIEIEVPAGVTGTLIATSKSGNTVLIPVKNGVVSVDAEFAEHLLEGNNGGPLPGFRKVTLEVKDPGAPAGQGGGKVDLPTKDEIIAFLKQREVKFHPATGEAKLQALYAAEMTKVTGEAQQEVPTEQPTDLTVEALPTLTVEQLTTGLAATENLDLLKNLVVAEANAETTRPDCLKAIEDRLAELTK